MNDVLNKTRRVLRDFDERVKAFRQDEARKGRPVVATCTKGCFACCREPLHTSRREAELIFASIPEPEKEAVRQRVSKWLDIVVPTGLAAEDLPSVHLWRPLMAWCPMLKDGLCTTYANRPIGCRSHMAAGPRVNCEDDELRYFQQYATMPMLTAYAVQQLAELEPEGVQMTHLPAWLALFFGLVTEDVFSDSFYMKEKK